MTVHNLRTGELLPPHLPTGGGGDNFDGMEARVAALEAHVAHVREDVSGLKDDVKAIRREFTDFRTGDFSPLKVDVALLRQRVDQLPGKGWVFSAVVLLALFIGALETFGPALRKAFGLP